MLKGPSSPPDNRTVPSSEALQTKRQSLKYSHAADRGIRKNELHDRLNRSQTGNTGFTTGQAKMSHANSRFALLRALVAVTLVDLLVQFLLGMWVNLFASLPSTFVSSASSSGMMGMMSSMMGASSMMGGGMLVLMVHMMNGYLLLFLSILVLAVSLYSGRAKITGLAIAGVGSILLAGISGLIFMFSGFQDDLYSYSMAVGFILAFGIYFLVMYFSK